MSKSIAELVSKNKSKKNREDLMSLYHKDTQKDLNEYLKTLAELCGSALKDHAGCSDIKPGLLKKVILTYVEGERKTGTPGFTSSSKKNGKYAKSLKRHENVAQKILAILLAENGSNIDEFKSILNDALSKKFNVREFDIDHYLSKFSSEEQQKLLEMWKKKQSDKPSSDKKLTHRDRVLDALLSIIQQQLDEGKELSGERIDEKDHVLLGTFKEVRPLASKLTELSLQQVSNALSQLEDQGSIMKVGKKGSSSQKLYLPKDNLTEAMKTQLAQFDITQDLSSETADESQSVSHEPAEKQDSGILKKTQPSISLDEALDFLSSLDSNNVPRLEQFAESVGNDLEKIKSEIELLEQEKASLVKKLKFLNIAIEEFKE